MADISSNPVFAKLKEVRSRMESTLSSTGSAPHVKNDVQSMAHLPLSLSEKYQEIDAVAIVRDNTAGDSREHVVECMGRLVKALNVLEKYGCNLNNPTMPRYWRIVKLNNPVFKATVAAIKGGRGVLYLYGYTIQQIDGLSFPDNVLQPDRDKVAAVTVEVMSLRLEVDMLVKGTHPHPAFFKDILPLVVQQHQLEGKVVSPGEDAVKQESPTTTACTTTPMRASTTITPATSTHPTATPNPTMKPTSPTTTPKPATVPKITPTSQAVNRTSPATAPNPTVTPKTAPATATVNPCSPIPNLTVTPTTPNTTPTTPTVTPIPSNTTPTTPTVTPIPSNTTPTTPTVTPIPSNMTPTTTPTTTTPMTPTPSNMTPTTMTPTTTSPITSTVAEFSPQPTPSEGNEKEAEPPTPSSPADKCNVCGGVPMVICSTCNHQPFCETCDGIFHRHPSRANHTRERIPEAKKESCSLCGVSSVEADCTTCVQMLCHACDDRYHAHPERKGHERKALTPTKTYSLHLSPWTCGHCTTVNEMRAVLCVTCDRPRLATPCPSSQTGTTTIPLSQNTEWQCARCTVVNQGSTALCEVCESPRVATPSAFATAEWTCQACTFANTRPSLACEMCKSPREDSAKTGVKTVPAAPFQTDARRHEAESTPEQERRTLRDDSRKIIQHIREAERRGVSPEEVCAALVACGGSNINPCDWLSSELPYLLDEICAMATSVQPNCGAEAFWLARDTIGGDGERVEEPSFNSGGPGVLFSRAEAKRAWLAAGGETERAVKRLLRDRQAKLRELRSLGFRDESRCEEALRLSGGEIEGALAVLQHPLLEEFRQRIWNDQPSAFIDPTHPDKQRICRRLLALYNLPSWGRCELALSLLLDTDATYTLEDVVEAVKESPNRDFISRLLKNDCHICLDSFPQSKMQSLTSCQCALCHNCFREYFNITVREKHIMDMVCPKCSGPDINDPEQMESYFSTLDVQLRDCLDRDVYEIFCRKLTEHALMKNPNFLWCCHCTFGFIYDGIQAGVTCSSCYKCFCSKCKKPWEDQHKDLSCEMFQQWKRENDPECQKQGLAGYLLDNGITCPSCSFQYALAKGGCMHFTCTRCKYQFCSGCNSPYHKAVCKTANCTFNCLHAHHPRDCLFYLRDWELPLLQALLQRNSVEFNTDAPNGTQADTCSVMEQKEEDGQLLDVACGIETQPGHAGLCDKHYREYLVSLINGNTLDPAPLYDSQQLSVVCRRYHIVEQREENEGDPEYDARLLQKLLEVPLGEKVPRRK